MLFRSVDLGHPLVCAAELLIAVCIIAVPSTAARRRLAAGTGRLSRRDYLLMMRDAIVRLHMPLVCVAVARSAGEPPGKRAVKHFCRAVRRPRL